MGVTKIFQWSGCLLKNLSEKVSPELVQILFGATMFFALSFWLHHPQISPKNYSDIVDALYSRDGVWNSNIPYVEYDLEYPVLCGLLIYVSSLAGNVAQYYLRMSVFLYVFMIGSVVIIYRLCKLYNVNTIRSFLYCICTPSFIYFSIYSFDWMGVFFLLLAIYLLLAPGIRSVSGSAFALGLSAASRIIPILCFPFLMLECKGWRERFQYAAFTFIGWLIPNAYLMLRNFAGFLYPYLFQAAWGIEDSWLIFFYEQTDLRSHTISSALLGASLVIILLEGRKLNLIQRCWLILLAFVVTSYKFPPQYMIMMLPFFALVPTVSYPIFIVADMLNVQIILWWFTSAFGGWGWPGGGPLSASSPIQIISAIRQALLFYVFINVLYPGWKKKLSSKLLVPNEFKYSVNIHFAEGFKVSSDEKKFTCNNT